MIRLDNVAYGFGAGEASGVTLSLSQGEMAVILGPKNSGKTGLLRVCLGTQAYTEGEVRLFGKKLDPCGPGVPDEFVRRIGVVTSHATLMDNMTIMGNIGLPLSWHLGMTGEPVRERVMPLIELFGLEECAMKFPHEITESELKMAMIARAVIFAPDMIVLDEPTSGDLDPGSFIKVFDAIASLGARNVSILITTSSPSLASFRNCTVHYMVEGRLVGNTGLQASPKAAEFVKQIKSYTSRQTREVPSIYESMSSAGGKQA